MSRVMAVSFNRYGRLYYLDAADYPGTIAVGDKVLVPTDEGTEVAECVWAPQWVTDDIGGLPAWRASRRTPTSSATSAIAAGWPRPRSQ